MAFPKSVSIIEVSPRDGLQNEAINLPTAIKVDLINKLATCGFKTIEATSFVSPKWIPQLADAKDVLAGINMLQGINYPVLVPNQNGMEKAVQAGAKSVAVFIAASETFSQKNTNCSIAESLIRVTGVMEIAKKNNIPVRGYISCVLGCPYEGKIAYDITAGLSQQLIDLGCYQVSLGDTIGVGTPLEAKKLIDTVTKLVQVNKLAAHFHDTYGQALANIYAILEQGVCAFDSSIGGIGGCPYAKGASGNVATEDLVYMLNGMGIETGLNLATIIEISKNVCAKLGHPPRSKLAIV